MLELVTCNRLSTSRDERVGLGGVAVFLCNWFRLLFIIRSRVTTDQMTVECGRQSRSSADGVFVLAAWVGGNGDQPA